MSYAEQAEELKQKVFDYIGDEGSWKLVKKSDKDVTVWSRPSNDFDGHMYKAEGMVDGAPEKVFEYADPVPAGPRSQWDKAVKSLINVETISDNLSVVRTCTHSAHKGIISGRDFVDLSYRVKGDGFIATIAKSIDHPSVPAVSEYVRGKNYPCGIVCYSVPGEPNKTKVVHLTNAELGGMLPRTVVELALPSNIIDFYKHLREVLADKN